MIYNCNLSSTINVDGCQTLRRTGKDTCVNQPSVRQSRGFDTLWTPCASWLKPKALLTSSRAYHVIRVKSALLSSQGGPTLPRPFTCYSFELNRRCVGAFTDRPRHVPLHHMVQDRAFREMHLSWGTWFPVPTTQDPRRHRTRTDTEPA